MIEVVRSINLIYEVNVINVINKDIYENIIKSSLL